MYVCMYVCMYVSTITIPETILDVLWYRYDQINVAEW